VTLGSETGILAARRLFVLALLVIGGTVALAASAPPAWGGCPACDEYIWNPPNPKGKGTSSQTDGSSNGAPRSLDPSAPSTGAGSLTGSARRAFAGSDGDRLGSNAGDSRDGGALDAIGGIPPAGSTAAGAGVLSAGTSAGTSPTGLIVLAAAALIGLAGLLVVRRNRRRRPAA
jgi:LPXTG-motif cell wall-anchored protein